MRFRCKSIDFHTAALARRIADKPLRLFKQIIEASNLMTMMVTHSMRDAIAYRNGSL